MKKNPGYVVVHPVNNKVLRWVSANQRGMPNAFDRAVELAAHYAAKDKIEIPVVASITRIPTGRVVTDLFYFGGGYVLVDGAMNVRSAEGLPKSLIQRRENIARKQDVPWREPEVQARLTYPGFHSAWDEPEDHPPYPMAGTVRRQQEKEQQQIIERRKAEMRELGDKPRHRLREGFIEKAPWGREWKSNLSPYYGDYDYEEAPEIYCPACGGEPAFMGTLGQYDWFRCRRCGLDFRIKTNPASLAQDVLAIYEARGERGANRHRILVTAEPDGCFVIRLVSRGVNYKSYGGICDQDNLNNLLMNMIYDLQRKAGLNYELVYP
ncbi:hypothetical protein L0244_21215 [bacterium]|nr:hypothetical protein [bacterium]